MGEVDGVAGVQENYLKLKRRSRSTYSYISYISYTNVIKLNQFNILYWCSSDVVNGAGVGK